MLQIENPAGGPGFKGVRGGDPDPQESFRPICFDCQGFYCRGGS